MRSIRFHLGTLVIVILLLGVGFAALRESSDIWESGIFTLTIGVLLTSILLAVHSSESRRAFWIGFALFGWVYLALTFMSSIESRLITTKGLAYLDSKVPGRSMGMFDVQISHPGSGLLSKKVQRLAFTPNGNQLATSGEGHVRIWDVTTGKLLSGWSGTTYNFIRIGHSLLALLVGWFGGQLSCRLCRASRAPAPSTAVDAEGNNP
jgi:WD40 repeat protein